MIAARPIAEVQASAPTESGRRYYRYYQRRLSLYLAALSILVGAGGIAMFIVFGARMVALESRVDGIWALGGIALFLTGKVLGGWMSRRLTCHLCHGPVLKDRGCHKHKQAVKLPGLTYRLTAALSAVLSFRFRCMYCGTGYRLKK